MSAVIDRIYERGFRKRFPPPTNARLAELEARLGISIPLHYRRFLLEYNGGYFSRTRLLFDGGKRLVDAIDVLFGVDASHESVEFASSAHLTLFSENVPPAVIPIGDTERGNLLVLLTDEGDESADIMLKTADKQNYIWLAHCTEDFFRLLQVVDTQNTV